MSRAAARRAVTGSLMVAAVLAGCAREADDRPATDPTPSPETTPNADRSDRSPRTGTVVTTASSDYGKMLFDKSRQAIYLFDKETSPRPRCYRDCAEAWPPVLTDGEPRAAGRAKQRLLGTTERKDGSVQVTYAGHPLYFYAHEGKREVLCHGVAEYGGVWLVVQPDGEAAA